MIAEKPSVSKSIAKALAPKHPKATRETADSITIWEFSGDFKSYEAGT